MPVKRDVGTGMDASRHLEEILGIKKIRRFELSVNYDGVAEVAVTFLPSPEQLKALTGDGIEALQKQEQSL